MRDNYITIMKSTLLTNRHLWFNVFRVAALAKAAIVGVSLGLALLGAFDVAFAVAAEHWWDAVRPDWIVNMAAAVGALGGIVVRVFA